MITYMFTGLQKNTFNVIMVLFSVFKPQLGCLWRMAREKRDKCLILLL